MSLGSLVFFSLFVGILFGAYLAIRRNTQRPALVGFGAILASIISMFAFSLSQGNVFEHALMVGIGMGGLFSVVTIALAIYFHSQELRQAPPRR